MKRWFYSAVFLLLGACGVAVYFWFRTTDDRDKPTIDSDMVWFKDVSDEVGLNFVHDAGDLSKYQLPQIHGSGVAIFDFDGDGRLDILLLNFGGPDSKSANRLFQNMPDGTFKDVTEGSGLGITGYCAGVAVGDVNNDGKPDVVITLYGGVKLFLNQGKGVFVDITEESGLRNPRWAASASFIDYDRDGWLDLVIVNYLDNDPTWVCRAPDGKKEFCGPRVFSGTVSQLFRNLGRSGKSPAEPVRFQDVTIQAGLAKAPGPGLGVFCADFNGDGWPDIFIANDARPNHLWINQKNGAFTEEALLRGLAVDSMGQPLGNMGVAIGDVDGNGLFDVYVTHLSDQHNTLWMQGTKRGQFRDRTAHAGLIATDWRGTGFGTLMGDFDNDGWPDIAVVNGRVYRGTSTPNPDLGDLLKHYSERNQLFRNDGAGKFRDISRSNQHLCGVPNIGRGLASGDLDGDGALDLVVTTVAGRARINRNVAPKRGHWLLVRAFDPRLNRDAYGAEITLQAGGRRWLRIINPADSYLSSSDPRAHFGLGAACNIDAIHVLWPDGRAEAFPGGGADQVLVLRRGEGKEQPRAGAK